jgi:hypothetical protein
MKSSMSRDRSSIGARCGEIRERFLDFATDRLDAMATGEVQGHLLSCQACSKAFGDLLMEGVSNGSVPLRTLPRLPPLARWDKYLSAGSGRFGTLWKSVRDALEAADARAREQARTRAEEIGRALDLLVPPAPLDPATVRARGALRVGKAALVGSTSTAVADVLLFSGESTGMTVRFAVDKPPRITRDGHFGVCLRTDACGFDGHVVICTITLPATEAVSFDGTVTRLPREGLREVRIDEAGVPGPAREIPLKHLTLAIITG